jgi:DNA polymerase V
MAIILVDCDNFFASCERIMQPKLNDVPVAVLSNNDGCIIARTSELREAGVKVGMPLFECTAVIEKLHARVFSANFLLYQHFATRLQRVLDKLPADSIEVYSIDESFIDINVSHFNGSPEKWAASLRELILEWTGIPVSIGIGDSRVQAKIATQLAKNSKQHVAIIEKNSNKHQTLLKKIPISDIWGVGRKLAPKLKIAGIKSAYDLMAIDRHDARFKLMDAPLVELIYQLNGWDTTNNRHTTHHSITRSRSYGAPVAGFYDLRASLVTFASEAAYKLHSKGMSTSEVTVYAYSISSARKRYGEKHAVTLHIPWTSDTLKLTEIVAKLSKQLFKKGNMYKKAGVIFSKCIAAEQLTLIGTEDSLRAESLMAAVDEVRSMYGNNSLHVASALSDGKWRSNSQKKSPYDHSSWQTIPTVRTN